MARVTAGVTTSLDGYITGPNDGPGRGLGEGGERLHYWVFGRPWRYGEDTSGEATGADKELLEAAKARVGAVVGGRGVGRLESVGHAVLHRHPPAGGRARRRRLHLRQRVGRDDRQGARGGESARIVSPAAIALQGPVDDGPADGEQLGEIVDAALAGAVHPAQFGLLLWADLGLFAAKLSLCLWRRPCLRGYACAAGRLRIRRRWPGC